MPALETEPPRELRKATRFAFTTVVLWALATGAGVWFLIAVDAWENAHPDVEDHGIATFVGLEFVAFSGICALLWLAPALMLRRGSPGACTVGITVLLLSAFPATLLLLSTLAFAGWGRLTTLAVVLIEAMGLTTVILASCLESALHLHRSASRRTDEPITDN